jgi:hypothetical protein
MQRAGWVYLWLAFTNATLLSIVIFAGAFVHTLLHASAHGFTRDDLLDVEPKLARLSARVGNAMPGAPIAA